MHDYKPRTRPLIPAGHRTWLAASRVKTPESPHMEDWTVDERIEALLEWITAPGADCSQRHDDLIALAELILKTRGKKVMLGPSTYTYDGDQTFGYGVQPIDSDTHDGECVTCGDAEVYQCGFEPDFDPHPYQTAEDEGQA